MTMLYNFADDFVEARRKGQGTRSKKSMSCCKRDSMQGCDPDIDWDVLEGMGNYRPRRAHRKSRNGCADCKRRRIKVRPIPHNSSKTDDILTVAIV